MSRLNRDDIDKYSDSDLHPSTRAISLDESIDFASLRKLIKQLRILDHAANSPITIHFHSTGGEVTWGLGMYDVIKSCRSEVTGIVVGECSSMAAVVLQACDVRLITPSSLLMAHTGTASMEEIPGVEAPARWRCELRQAKLADDYLFARVKGKKAISRSAFTNQLHKGIYMLGAEAVEWGLADAVTE